MAVQPSTLQEHLLEVASEVEAEQSVSSAPVIEFSRGGRRFAAVSGDVAEFRLDPEIAEAALGTPDTAGSARGADWVRLAPASPQPHDLDRARAWFLSAWRRAGETP